MQIVIDILDGLYNQISKIQNGSMAAGDLLDCIKNGISLPEGHGDLIDRDEILLAAWQNFYKHEDEWEKKDKDYIPVHRFYDQNGFECCQQTIVNATTIIEADKEGKNEN